MMQKDQLSLCGLLPLVQSFPRSSILTDSVRHDAPPVQLLPCVPLSADTASFLVPCSDSLFLVAREKLSHEFAMEGGHIHRQRLRTVRSTACCWWPEYHLLVRRNTGLPLLDRASLMVRLPHRRSTGVRRDPDRLNGQPHSLLLQHKVSRQTPNLHYR